MLDQVPLWLAQPNGRFGKLLLSIPYASYELPALNYTEMASCIENLRRRTHQKAYNVEGS
jgi:hypothetical protein